MRCIICDWAPGAPESIYNRQLVMVQGQDRKLLKITTPEGVEFICSACLPFCRDTPEKKQNE